MSLYYLLLCIASFVTLITMFARLNELSPKIHSSPFWWFRRVGFLMVIAACSMVMAAPVAQSVPYWWQLAAFLYTWGTMVVFITSPNQKPWWDLIVGDHRKGAPTTIMGEVNAIRDAFSSSRAVEKRMARRAEDRKE